MRRAIRVICQAAEAVVLLPPDRTMGYRYAMGQSARLLVIDDEVSLLTALADSLRSAFAAAQVDTAPSAAAALYSATVYRYDAILCDLTMPHIQGFGLVDRLKRASPETPVLVMSGQVDGRTCAEANDHGAWGVVAKPVARGELLMALHGMLNAADQAPR